MKYLALALSVLGLAATAGCDDTTDVAADQLNLNRPVDVAFACYGGLRLTNGQPASVDQQVTSVPQPIASCDIRSQPPTDTMPVPVPPGQEDLTASGGETVVPPAYYAFILQSAPGTVEIATWQVLPVTSFVGGEVTVIDADPLTPGVNGISIGEEPIAIQTDDTGCYEVTANAGSCDMSILDINTAVSLETKAVVTRQNVVAANGTPIRAKPAAMVTQPPIETIGQVCQATPQGIMYVAYPSCHLVAAVDVSAGKVVGGIQFDAAGNATILPDGNVTCPIDECGGGGAVTPGPRPVTLDLKKDPRSLARRMLIGSQNSNVATIVELDANYMPQTLSTLAFQDPKGTLGLTTVALTPQIGMGGQSHFIVDDNSPGGEFQFIYAVATDGSVRVADILSLNKECDTQVDPRFAYTDTNIKQMSCFPVGDPATPPRRSGAIGPGIQLPFKDVPLSVSIFKSDVFPDDTRLLGGYKTIGYFGLITGSDGHTFVVNVDDDDFYDTVQAVNPLLSPVPMILAHQLRDSLPNRGSVASVNGIASCFAAGTDPDAGAGNDGGPRTDGDPTRAVPAGLIADAKVQMLPTIRHVDCNPMTVMGETDAPDGTPVSTLSYDAPVPVRDLAYPDMMGLKADETWELTWEGSLSDLDPTQTIAVGGPGVRESVISVDADAMRLTDDTTPFCDAGTEPYDIVQLDGCNPANQDRDCPLGYECFVHPQSQVVGLGACMLSTEADRLANACKEYLTSLRRYTVGPTPTSGQLVLLPRRHHLRSEPLDGCDLANDTCQKIGNYESQLLSTLNPRDAATVTDPHTYVCAVDDLRPARAAGKGSCLETCQADSDCVSGLVCDGGFCMEGVTPPQACVNAPQKYELRAHDAFTLLGSLSGYIHPIIADGAKNCVTDPKAAPTKLGRIPLTAPPCDPTADPRTGALPGGGFEPNPCLENTTEADLEPNPDPSTCAVGVPKYSCTVAGGCRPTTAVKLRNPGMTLELVDPTSTGDASCTLDRAGNGLGALPLVFTGYQISWRVTAGFNPLILGIQPSYPVKVVTGPGQSMWVIDEGDYLSTTLGVASTLGKVFRVEAQQLTVINTLQ